MQNIFKENSNFLLRKKKSITIKQANIFTTLVIFIFTIIFAYLLIIENYHDYERALYADKITEYSTQNVNLQHQKREAQLKTLLIKNTIAIATLAFILFSIMVGFYKIFNTLLQRDMQAFLDFFKSSTHYEQVLNPHVIFFKEFKTMVGYANEMVNTIHIQKENLIELNVGLEDRIRAKTVDLENILAVQKEFLRHTIHETNTPLSVILTSIELLNMKNEKDRHLSKIEAAAKNIFSIYDDLSYLVKKDQVEYPKVALDLVAYLKSRIDFFAEVAQLSKLSFAFTSNTPTAFIYFNETKLQRIVDNTITNAIKYTLADEIINVEIKTFGSFVDLLVGSRSKEIKDKEKVFDAYYREEKNRDGFGIGLRLVKSICEEEDVKILLESNDEITTFIYRYKMMGV